MTNIIPPDLDVRAKIERDLDTNFLVEAGAGSGKTSSLVKRMLSLVISGKYRVNEIAAVTFTRKAAAELRERFQNKLEEIYRETGDVMQKEFLEQALLDLDKCFMGTVHSFCARLLRERPVEAGLDPEFKEMDELQNKLMKEQAWESFLIQVKTEKPDVLDQLNKIGVSHNELKQNFIKLNGYPDVDIVYTSVPKPELKAVLDRIKSLVHLARKAIPFKEPEKGWDKLQAAIRKTLRYLHYFDMSRDTNIIKILSNFEKEINVTQNRWNSKEEAKQFRDEFNALAIEVVGPVIKQWREYCHYHIMAFLLPAVKHYEKMRYDKCYLNFEDLLMKTSGMLRDYPEVRQYFQSKFRCLLVDEFQDTDPIQAEIMFFLTGGDVNERDWQLLLPKPGALFIVGDPKQSIYRFRRADIDTYNLVKELILKSGGEVLKLTSNFRSVQALGRWFNPTFGKLLPEKGDSYQAEYSELHTLQPDKENTEVGVRVLEIPNIFSNKAEIVDVDADYIAKIIKDALNGNIRLSRTPEETDAGVSETPRPSDFMILLRYKDSMDVYARALEKYGIPVSMAGGSSLSQSYEISELYKLLKFLADIENQVSLVAVLRGLFFGISDDSLYQFKKAGGRFSLLSVVPEQLDNTINQQFTQSLGKLKKYYRWTKQYNPSVALEKIIIDLGLVPFSLTGEMGKSRCGYLYQILELLRKSEVDGNTAFNLIVEQFKIILDSDIEEELDIVAEEQNAVRLMNLHKAKGLEAPVVFLAHPYKKPEPRADQHIRRVGQSPYGYFVCNRSKGDYHSEIIGQPPGWENHQDEELKYLTAEEIRLLYVAATRAKNLLVISQSNKDAELKKNPWGLLLTEDIQDHIIAVPNVDAEEKPDVGLEINLEQLQNAREQFATWIPGISLPSYCTRTPTGTKKADEQAEIKRLTGGGMAWGTVIHKAFEELVKGNDDLETIVELALLDNGENINRKDEVLQVVEQFMTNDLWKRILEAELSLTEVPFSLFVEQGHPIYDKVKGESGLPVLLSGVIDLVFKEPDGWVIVDYKTDRAEDEQSFKALIDMYSNQIFIYCRVWEELTNQKVKSGLIYFTQWDGIKIHKVYCNL